MRKPPNVPAWEWRQRVIAQALAMPAGSSERRQAVAAASAQHGVCQATIYSWIKRHERGGGLRSLLRKRRDRKTYYKCLISRAWDGLSIAPETRLDIYSKLLRRVCSLWAGDVPGAKKIARAATTFLMQLTSAAGVDLPREQLRAACRVTRPFVERQHKYKIVAIHDRDAKRFADQYMPRVRRSRAGLKPMSVVIGDVHPIDILVRRDDGSIATPRAIAWQDWATNRVFMMVVLLEKGKGIRQEHVIASFIDMVVAWGMPSVLYLDNGGEYGWNEFIEDALRITDMTVECLSSEFGGLVKHERKSMVVRARPYNAPAKAIEGTFSVLEGGVFRMITGWIGGDRMRKKTANVGKEPTPFPGTFPEFKQAIAIALAEYHATDQRGQLRASPDAAYEAFIAGGWRPIVADRWVLEAAFSEEMVRTVRNGVVSIDGAQYDHDDLAVHTGQAIAIRRPKIGDGSHVTATVEGGRTLLLQRRPVFAALDPAGAQFQGERAKALKTRVAELRRETDAIDTVAIMRENVAAMPPAPALPKPIGMIRLTEDIHAAAEVLAGADARVAAAPQGNAAAALWLNYGQRRRKETRRE